MISILFIRKCLIWFNLYLYSCGEDSLVVKDGVAESQVEVVVLDAGSHPEPRFEAARARLQESRLGMR